MIASYVGFMINLSSRDFGWIKIDIYYNFEKTAI